MQLLLQILLGNAVGAAALSVLVWFISLAWRKPALVRALWIIVLLKLLTPPFFRFPAHRWFEHPAPVREAIPRVSDAMAPIDESEIRNLPRVPVVALVASGSRRIPPATLALQYAPILWVAGSGCLVVLALSRSWALARMLRPAALADQSVLLAAAQLATRLGLARPAQVWLVPGVVCPALWAFGRTPRIIVPLELWNRLDDTQRKSVLAHELAHLRRGDHWVRLLELIATIAYWWHPAVWVARRQIHDCEEQCCDAWVLWAMPASAHSYGAALLEAVDFVSTHRPTRPALAAGLGEFRHLKRRLLMIKKQRVARALSRAGLLVVCSAAAVALPVGLSVGQALPPGAEGQSAEQAEAAAKAHAEIAAARARVQKLAAQLAEAQSRLVLLEQAAGLPPETSSGLPGRPGTAGIGSSYSGGEGYSGTAGRTAAAGTMGPAGGSFGGGVRAGAMGGPAVVPGGNRFGGGGGGFSAGGFGAGPSRSPEDRRLDHLEKQLQELMQQVRELKEQKGAENDGHPRGIIGDTIVNRPLNS